MAGFDPHAYAASDDSEAFDPHAYAADDPSAFDGVVKSAINSLPMIGGVAGGILGTPADAIAGPMGNVVGAGIGGYLGTSAKNLINTYYDPQSAPKTVSDAITQPIVGGMEQGAMQGIGEGMAPYINKGIQAATDAGSSAAKWAGTKLLSSLGGVSPDVIKEYAQYSGRINSASGVDSLKDISDGVVGKLASDVEAKKITQDQAQAAFDGLKSDLKDAYRTAGYDARDAVTSAQQTVKDAHNANLQQLSSDVYDSVNQLKSDVQSGSKAALDTLNKSDASVDLAPVYSQIDNSITGLQKSGTDEALSVADKLQAYKTRLMDNNWANIPAPEAKKLIQGLDQATTYSPMAGSFDQAKNAAFKGIRSTLDQTLKQSVPEYAAAMEPVASDADLLSRVQPFGDKQTGAGILGRINAPNQMENNAALQELGKKYGADYVSAANPDNLPEQAILTKAQAAQQALRPDVVADKIDQTLAASRQKAGLDLAQSGLDAAQQKLAPFKSLAPNGAGQTQAQQKLIQLGKGKNIELDDMFQKLGSLSNTDFVQAMKDNSIQAAFQKGATNGSRNTLLGALTGFTFGGVGGAAIGGSAGRVADQWGPAITKKVLDGAIAVSKNPSVEAISNLSLPEPIKKNMVIGLQNYLSKAGQTASQVAEQSAAKVAGPGQQQNRTPAKGPDAWAQQGIQKLGIQDNNISARLLQDPKAKQLLIQASDLTPGSKAMKNINDQIQKGWGNK